MGADFNAHLSINTSAQTKTDVPPTNYNRAGPKHPNITLPYSKVVTASACTSAILTLLLCKPSSLE